MNASCDGNEDSVIMLLKAGADELITDRVSKNIIFHLISFCVFILLFFANNFHYFLFIFD